GLRIAERGYDRNGHLRRQLDRPDHGPPGIPRRGRVVGLDELEARLLHGDLLVGDRPHRDLELALAPPHLLELDQLSRAPQVAVIRCVALVSLLSLALLVAGCTSGSNRQQAEPTATTSTRAPS